MKADYLVSRDNDLLDLMKWEREEGREFPQAISLFEDCHTGKLLAAVGKDDEAPSD